MSEWKTRITKVQVVKPAREAGEACLVLAGGTESASRAPARGHRTAWGDVPYARAAFAPTPWADPGMGAAADELARRRGVTRERQEAYAVRSHARALAAHAGGRFAAETVRVGTPGRSLTRYERARRLDPTVLARLSAAFTPGGTVTAATASPVSDGAASVSQSPEGMKQNCSEPDSRTDRSTFDSTSPTPAEPPGVSIKRSGCPDKDTHPPHG